MEENVENSDLTPINLNGEPEVEPQKQVSTEITEVVEEKKPKENLEMAVKCKSHSTL